MLDAVVLVLFLQFARLFVEAFHRLHPVIGRQRRRALWWQYTIPYDQGSVPVRKRTGTLRIWRARAYIGVWGRSPPEAEGILLPRRANFSLSFKWNLNFAAICRKGPERRSGDQKKNRNGVPERSGSKRTLCVGLCDAYCSAYCCRCYSDEVRRRRMSQN